MKKKWIIGLIVAAIALTTIFAGAAAFAQTGNGSANPSSGVYLDSPLLVRLATALGLTTSELSAELGTGKTLAFIAQEQNVPTEALVDAIIAPHTDQLALQVKYGYLTVEQSQALLKAARERASLLLEQNLSGAAGSGNGYFGHCGGYAGGFGPGYGMMGPGMMGGFGSGYGMMGPGARGFSYNNPSPNPSGTSQFGTAPGRGFGMMGRW